MEGSNDATSQTDDLLERIREHAPLAYVLLRVGLGINILIHGVSRLGDIGGFAEAMSKGFSDTFFPMALAEVFGYVVVPVEVAVGALLTVGLFTRRAAITGGVLMLPLIFGINLQQKWTVAGLQLVYLWLYAVLIAFASLDRYGVDALRS